MLLNSPLPRRHLLLSTPQGSALAPGVVWLLTLVLAVKTDPLKGGGIYPPLNILNILNNTAKKAKNRAVVARYRAVVARFTL